MITVITVPVLQAREPSATLQDLIKLEEKVERVVGNSLPSTVALVSEETGSSGSGVIVSKDGLILTAAHVVQGMTEVDVIFPDGKSKAGRVLGANFSKDIGMVMILEKGPWPFVNLGESKPLVAGDWVVALGHSAGFDPARTAPLRFGRVLSDGPGNYFTTDATLIGGDSGGPLFDLNGKLVGINSSIGESWSNNNHAGIDGFREDWDRLLAGETWGALQMNPMDNQERPMLGIGMDRRRMPRGVLINEVRANSPAAEAGVRVGDVIVSMDGEVVNGGAKLQSLTVKRQAGDMVQLGILRGSKEIVFSVKLVKLEDLYKTR
ncbi:MAG: S1C family serine protease [Luteolibacter sp.]